MIDRWSGMWLRIGSLAAGLLVAAACAAGWVAMSLVRQDAVYHFHPGLLASASVWTCRRRGEARIVGFGLLAAAISALIVASGWVITAGGGSVDPAPLVAVIAVAGFMLGGTAPVGAAARR